MCIQGVRKMKFERIPKKDAKKWSGYIVNEDKFYRFINEFNIIGVVWSQPQTISASYFLRLLENGSSEKARGYGRKRLENDEHSKQLGQYYSPLLDHGALWKRRDGSVICTAMPYGDKESVTASFDKMIKEFEFPKTIKMKFLDNRYRYRTSGDIMIIIYCEALNEIFNQDYSIEKLCEKAKASSQSDKIRSRVTKSYTRNKYVSEYAKLRADGKCQLCGNLAPFYDNEGRPYLEAHHVIRLADGGEDSDDNVVALCPNCHRKMHSLNLEEDVNKLLKIVSSIKK